MQIKNNYNLEWKILKDGIEEDSGEGIFNGDFGYITDIDEEESILKVIFDEEKVVVKSIGGPVDTGIISSGNYACINRSTYALN